MPSSAFTEQDGYYCNLEGKIQKAYKATYPPGQAKEDWEVINNLAYEISGKYLFNKKNELIDAMFNFLKLNKDIKSKKKIINFSEDHNINVNNIDYYFSNVIARSSKTMAECRDLKIKISKTGTDG